MRTSAELAYIREIAADRKANISFQVNATAELHNILQDFRNILADRNFITNMNYGAMRLTVFSLDYMEIFDVELDHGIYRVIPNF